MIASIILDAALVAAAIGLAVFIVIDGINHGDWK